MKRFNLYKNGRYGMIHITSVATNNLTDAINFYKKNFGIKIGKELFQYKVTGLLKTITS
jgi:predicted enzyme related to lactoylglutathione lyase